MDIALAALQDHIATVFDSADSFVIIDVGPPEMRRVEPLLPEVSNVQMIKTLHSLKITVLLCGAISDHCQQMIEADDILVISFLKGEIKDVAAAFFANCLDNPAFCLPGCHRGWQRMAMGKSWEGTPSLTERPRGQRRRGKS